MKTVSVVAQGFVASSIEQRVDYSLCVSGLTFRRRIKSRLPFAGIIRRLPYSTRFQDKG